MGKKEIVSFRDLDVWNAGRQVQSARALLGRVGQMLHGLERSLKRQQMAAIGSSLAVLICVIGRGLLLRLI